MSSAKPASKSLPKSSAPRSRMPGAVRPGAGGGALRSMGSRGASYVQASQGRQTAFLLIVAILLARLMLTNQLQTFWGVLWGPSRPLGQALPKKVAASGSSTVSTTTKAGA